MRVVFLGSPEFAIPALERLIASEHDIAGVYTQPDRPSGRGRKLSPPPVKVLALEHGLPVFQPQSISSPESIEQLRTLRPDAAVIAAYGQILKQAVLDVPPKGFLNIHASLLPRWRGAAPIPAAILHGDSETGATIMLVERKLDAGPMLGSVTVPIRPDDTTATLTPRIAEAGADLLLDLLPKWGRGEITPQPQDDALATYAPVIKKSDALIDWERDDAELAARKVRAYNPWPVAYSYLGGQPLRILEAVALQHEHGAPPGTIFTFTGQGENTLLGAGFAVVAARHVLGVVRVQGPGGKPMPAAEYVRGHRDIIGKRLANA
ncbi:MAG TPA: methionyl-tRNA formyltransferase [Dehalococcoidia bacterium]|nr:methionyl-tRNA formyltransferase [Dehalococcoidia bacterium]